MNVKEGMRRLSILLGVSGGLLGGCLANSEAQNLWNIHTAHRRFEALMASTTMQKVAKAARDYQNGPWVKYRSNERKLKGTYSVEDIAPGTVSDADLGKYGTLRPASEIDQAAEERKKPGGIVVSVNLDGIRDATVDKGGLVSSIELSTGESVPRTASPHLRAYLGLFLYPVLGFLLPWGAIRVLTWVGSGFFVQRQ